MSWLDMKMYVKAKYFCHDLVIVNGKATCTTITSQMACRVGPTIATSDQNIRHKKY